MKHCDCCGNDIAEGAAFCGICDWPQEHRTDCRTNRGTTAETIGKIGFFIALGTLLGIGVAAFVQ